jgi:ribose transport system substrate-binding protein
VGGEDGVNYTKYVGGDVESDGRDWGNFIKEQFPDGANIDFFSGPAGNSFGLALLAGVKEVLGDDGKYKFLNPEPFHVTNWDPALTQQVLTAEVAKHGADIDVILSDFGASLIGGLPAFEDSGLSIPTIATQDANILGCFWTEHHEANPDFKLLTTSSGNDHSRLAVQWAVAEATGGMPPDTDVYVAGVVENSVTGEPKPVGCRSDLPGDIYLSAEMAPEKQAEAINQ